MLISKASVARLVERLTLDQEIAGSIPQSGKEILSNFTLFFLISVERQKASDLHTWKYSEHLQKA